MGSFANALFTMLLGWMQGAVSTVWNAFTTDNSNSFLFWVGRHWLIIAGFLCVFGLTLDLIVFLLRRRDRRYDSALSTDAVREAALPDIHSFYLPESEMEPDVEPSADDPPDSAEYEEDSETEDAEMVRIYSQSETDAVEKDAGGVITKAGYYVPSDSPYKRPANLLQESKTDNGNVPEEQSDQYIMRTAGKRRRVRIGDLFNDPEEELREFDAPHHLIDSRKAYHDPVYPHDWNKKKDES